MNTLKSATVRVMDVVLTVLLTLSTLLLFTETFSLIISPLCWVVAALLALLCPLAAGCRGNARHALLGAVILTAAVGVILNAETLFTSIGQLLDAIDRRYETVYQGQEIWGFWWEDHTGAMTLLGTVLAAGLGFSLGGRRKRWLPAVLATVLPFSLCIAVTTLPTWPARVATVGLLAGWLTLALTGPVRKNDPRRGSLLALMCLPLLALLCGGGILAMKPDTYVRPAWLEETLEAVESRWDNLLIDWGLKDRPEGNTPGLGTVRPNTDDNTYIWTDHLNGLSMWDVGPQRYTGQLVLKVRSDTLGRVYLRGYSMGSYVNNAWLDPSLQVNTMFSPLLYPGNLLVEWEAAPMATMDVQLENYASLAAPVPYYATETPGDWFNDTYLTWDTSSYSVPYLPYTGDFSEFPIDGSKTAPIQYTAEVWKQYTYLQPGLRDQLLALLAEEGITEGPDVIEQVAEFVKNRATYNLFAKPMPDGSPDFVMYFLNQSREGYCVHFATAATLLYRSLGIPARYVSGFTCDITMANTWTPVADDDAHAWVEVLVDGVGWMPVEVTPGMEIATPTTTTPPSMSTTTTDPGVTTTREDSDPTAPTTTVTTVAEQPGKEPAKAVNSTAVLAIALPLLLVAAVILQWQWRVTRHRRQFIDADVNRSMIHIWKYARHLTRLGGRVSPEVKRLAEQAYFSEKGITKSQRDEAAAEVSAALQAAWPQMSLPRRLLATLVFALK
ncbi:MAG: transglutaminase domain-containing protein [Clostridia bacterium]|nr:transglutaminase domain-containing protein [Clostridia bacterium]